VSHLIITITPIVNLHTTNAATDVVMVMSMQVVLCSITSYILPYVPSGIASRARDTTSINIIPTKSIIITVATTTTTATAASAAAAA
jgi:hypothetical protein